jgi:hypothetical protein
MKDNIRRLFVLLFASLVFNVLNAQNAVTAVGGSSSGSGGSISYSVGQVSYTTASGTNGSANQGVQQPYEFFNVGIVENPDINLQLTVYPNPTLSQVNLNIGNLNPVHMVYQLFDSNGKLLISKNMESIVSEIRMQSMPAGIYLLKVLDGKSELRSFKIVKK